MQQTQTDEESLVDWLRREASNRKRRKNNDAAMLTAAAEEIDDLRSYFKWVRLYCVELHTTMAAQRKYIEKLEAT